MGKPTFQPNVRKRKKSSRFSQTDEHAERQKNFGGAPSQRQKSDQRINREATKVVFFYISASYIPIIYGDDIAEGISAHAAFGFQQGV